MLRGVRGAVLAMLVLLSVVGCTSPEAQIREQVLQDDIKREQVLQDDIERDQVLQDYIERERDAGVLMVAALPDVYSLFSVTGQAGTTPASLSVVKFTYKYIRRVEFGNATAERPSWVYSRPSWADPLVSRDQLELAKAQLASVCETLLFPSMREAGIVGPIRVEYVYLNPTGDVSWDASCESFE